MLPIEGLGDGGFERSAAKILGQHAGPGHGLQHGPMTAHGRDERGNDNGLAKLAEHSRKLAHSPPRSNAEAAAYLLFFRGVPIILPRSVSRRRLITLKSWIKIKK